MHSSRLMLLLAAFAIPLMLAATPPKRVIVDTDSGSDDLLAIAFLLSRPDIEIEAITIVNGLAHVPEGARNVLRLLEMAGRSSIPVYEGALRPTEGSSEFPAPWRIVADSLPNVDFPATSATAQPVSALAFLRQRLANAARPVSVLALGPLTNLAEVLTAAPKSALAIDDLVIMGGAVRVPGNVSSGGPLSSDNRTAEWNFYIDPAAAHKVLESIAACRLVPLDASNTVPFNLRFLNRLKSTAKSKLGAFAVQVLESNRVLMEQQMFFAWDPLAAVALVTPAVLKISSVALAVQRQEPEAGRTAESATARPVRVALAANPALFEKVFLETMR